MKQRKFRKKFWCFTFKGIYSNLNIFMKSHQRKVK